MIPKSIHQKKGVKIVRINPKIYYLEYPAKLEKVGIGGGCLCYPKAGHDLPISYRKANDKEKQALLTYEKDTKISSNQVIELILRWS